jgi:hypothetical protein
MFTRYISFRTRPKLSDITHPHTYHTDYPHADDRRFLSRTAVQCNPSAPCQLSPPLSVLPRARARTHTLHSIHTQTHTHTLPPTRHPSVHPLSERPRPALHTPHCSLLRCGHHHCPKEANLVSVTQPEFPRRTPARQVCVWSSAGLLPLHLSFVSRLQHPVGRGYVVCASPHSLFFRGSSAGAVEGFSCT